MALLVVSLLLIAVVSLVAMGVFMILDIDPLVNLFAWVGLLSSTLGMSIVIVAVIFYIILEK